MTITDRPDLRSRADQSDILLAFVDRLREHPQLSEQNAIIADQAVPEQFPGGGYCIVVAPGPGQFPGELWNGGHHATATEDGSVIVGCYCTNKRDRPGRREATLLGRRHKATQAPALQDRPDLMRWKRDILSLLTVWNKEHGPKSQAWEPTKIQWDAETSENLRIPLCRDIPVPVRVTGILEVPEHPGWLGFQITFSVAWDWDLYAR